MKAIDQKTDSVILREAFFFQLVSLQAALYNWLFLGAYGAVTCIALRWWNLHVW